MNYRFRCFPVAVLGTLAASLLLTSAALAQVSSTVITTVLGGAAVSSPQASSVDAHGNIYVANTGGTSVLEIPANGGPAITVKSGLATIRGIAADGLGNIYVAQTNVTSILKIPAGGGPSTTLGSVSRPFLMAVDSANNLYVADSSNSRIVKFAGGAGPPIILPFTGLVNPHGVAVDAAGDVFATSFSTDTTIMCITELTAAGTQITLPITGLNGAWGISVDAAGDIFVIESQSGRLLEYPTPVTNTPIVLVTGLGTSSAQAVSLSPRGDIVYNNTAKVYALQSGAADFYGAPVASNSGIAALTFKFSGAKTLGAPVYLSNNSSAVLFKDGGSTGITNYCTSGKAFAAGGSCILNVVFAPQQAGSVSGSVVLMDNTNTPLATVSLTGVGDAPAVAFSPGTRSIFLSSLGLPAGVALDAGGNLYLADTTGGTVSKISSAGVSTALAFSGLSRPSGVAVDGAGSVYVSDSSNNAVYKLTTASVQSTIPATGLSAPMGIAIDGANNLYIADSGNSRVLRIDSLGNQTTIPFTGLASPGWVALDPAGDIFISDTGKVIEYSITGTQTTLPTNGLSSPAGLVISANGSLFVADNSNGDIFVLPTTGSSFTLAPGLSAPTGLALALNGNLYVANANAAQVVLLDRTQDTIAFPSTAAGATSPAVTATVQNIGNTALNYSAFSVSAGFAQQTPVAAADCGAAATVLPAALCNINLTFSPTALGTVTGTVTQTDNALNAAAATQTIQLTGTSIRATTTTLALSAPATGNPIYGQAVTITASVAPGSGSGTPTGTVSFSLDGGTAGAGMPIVNGQAVFSPTVLSAGAHNVTATYSGDGTFATTTSSPFSVTVSPAVLNVNPTSQTRMYNVANQPLAYTFTGFAYTDTAAAVSGTPVLSTVATTTSPVGSYPISVALGTLSAANYTFNPMPGTITVTQATNTVTFPAIANVTYGIAPIPLTASANSGLAITYSVISGPARVTSGVGAAVTITGIGAVTLAANQAGDTNYLAAAQVTRTFTAAPAVLMVTANNLSKESGQANPPLTYTITGLVNSDSASVVTGAPSLSTTATASSPFGTYPITITQGNLAAANYTFAFVNGTLSVTGSAQQTITFGTLPNAIYGASPILLAATASSGVAVEYTVSGPAALTGGNTLVVTGVGTVSVRAAQPGNSTYAAAAPVTQTFIVTPATLTVTTANASRTINTANPAFTYTITGFVNNDPTTVASGAPSITTTATAGSPVGTYPITTTAGTLVAANYNFAFTPATLTVNSAQQTIAFAALPNVIYGAAPISLPASATSNLAIIYTVTGPATLSGSTVIITGVGLVSVTASQAGDATYAAATPVTQSFTVAPAALTVKPSDETINFGTPIPTTFAYTIIGFVNRDTQSVVTGAPAITTIATASSGGGTFPITLAPGTLAAANYTFLFVPGTLTISATGQTISFAALTTIPQTTATVTLAATASSGLPVGYTLSSGSPATLSGNVLTITGPGVITVTAVQTGNSSYSAAVPVTQKFTVTGTTTTGVTLSVNTVNQGTNVTLTAKIAGKISGSLPSGTVNFYADSTLLGTVALVQSGGNASLTTTAIPSGSVLITAAYSGDSLFSASTSNASPILVVAQDFNVSASSTNLTILAGQTTTTAITLTPVGGYSQTVSFACGSLPANLECAFAPPAFNFYPGTGGSSAAQSTTLTLTAMATSAQLNRPQTKDGRVTLAALFLALPFCLSPLMYVRRRGKSLRKSVGLMLFLLTTCVLAGITGCGSNATIYPAAGTYNIPVTFNDGTTVTHVLTLTVTIQ